MYNSTEQQGNEEVGQLTGGQIDTRDLKTQPRPQEKEQDTNLTDTTMWTSTLNLLYFTEGILIL